MKYKVGRVVSYPLRYMIRSIRWQYQKLGNRHRCYICQRHFGRFRPFGGGWKSVPPLARNLEIVGSDVENYACPFCGCSDRERHLVMYFDRVDLWAKVKNGSILHFAPERRLSARIVQQHPATYVKGDLSPSSPDIRAIDVTQIPFEDQTFDLIICNHVLEHVPDDLRALSELVRVLRPGGFCVLQTPYSPLLENTYCDPLINTDDLRLRHYGQEDHVRVYGRDLFERIRQAGLGLHLKRHADFLSDMDAFFWGVNPKEDLILAIKEAPSGLPRGERTPPPPGGERVRRAADLLGPGCNT